ncbi:hypothetical protein [Chitinophaga sp. CF418]|uniref:hypothetical protein n=1 Tax=Chitinophaga sp. CF418 TaxID=1855287 RepID=UPI00122D1AA5|nr:hypothetical protein [Chitinophaga sp. CF418]
MHNIALESAGAAAATGIDWKVILGAIAASTLTSTFISAIISWKDKRITYRDEYYKRVINKRIEAYETVDKLMQIFKRVAARYIGDTQVRLYAFFIERSNPDEPHSIKTVHHEIGKVLMLNNWIDHRISEHISQINQVLNHILITELQSSNSWSREDYIEIGIRYYARLDELRTKIENRAGIDWNNLHKKNGITNGYQYEASVIYKIKSKFIKTKPLKMP